ncbi:MAG TPA: ABC transporter permease [Candidatus Lustribacter sp.]|jgi:ABC-type nitrate/sulfonate/bicarbonate transport system permease component|nr:ABC transporter permease [Candidatus Lustribacter sp.]
MTKIFNRGNAAGIITVIVLLGAWQVIAMWKQTVYVPPVSTIFLTFLKEWFSPTFHQQAVPSLYRMAVGYFCASVIGICIGITIGSFKRIYQLLDPVLQFWRAIPATAIIPVGILLIGIGDQMKMVVICFGAMWPILINSADGARLVPTERLDTARIFGLSNFETLIRVIVPSATPMIAAGMRTGLSIAFIMIVVSEMIGSTDGLGYYILQAQRTFAIPEMYGGILLLAILGFLLNTGFVQIERRVLAWHYGQSARTV